MTSIKTIFFIKMYSVNYKDGLSFTNVFIQYSKFSQTSPEISKL